MTTTAPLTGVRVLDFTHVLAGPFCTRLLADLGADVVRVESTKHPDYPWPSGYVAPDGRHASYLNTNRNKRSIAIDLKQEAGKDIALRLAQSADVIAENFSAGVLERLGLGYEKLRKSNPGIIYLSMSGYGHSGPRSDWTSMNMNLQGYSGLMTVTGAEGDPPTAISNSWNDYVGGLHACFAVQQALTQRNITNQGARLDLSQFECSASMIGPLLLASALNGTVPPRLGNRSLEVAPQGVYRCAGKDQWCAISVQNDEQWQALLRVIGDAAWGSDARFASVQGRREHHDEIDQHIEAWTKKRPHKAAEALLKSGGVCAERVRRIDDLMSDSVSTTVFHKMDEPRVGTMLTTALPFNYSTGPLPEPRSAPSLGEQTEEVLRDWLKLPDQEIHSLQEKGALV
ncbi:MAG: CoA transferase [Deltaproteobacteria bacterium]|nr:CoA transferase [Deltaproteobacteria bacterium]